MNPKSLKLSLQSIFYCYEKFDMQVLTLSSYIKSKCELVQILQFFLAEWKCETGQRLTQFVTENDLVINMLNLVN